MALRHKGYLLLPRSLRVYHRQGSEKGALKDMTFALGNIRLLEDAGVDPGGLRAEAEKMRTGGQTVMFVAVDGRLLGYWVGLIRSRIRLLKQSSSFTKKTSES